MKSLRIFIVIAIVSLALVLTTEAQEGFLDIYEVKIKPGHEQAYEDLIKKYIEACEKVKSPYTWSTYSVVVGKPGGTYRFVTTFEKWAERDTWPQDNALETAFGKEEAQRMWSEAAQGIESGRSRVWRFLPEGSSNLTSEGPSVKFYDVQIREVKQEMAPAYRSLQRKWKAAYEASASKPVVARATLVYGPSQGATFYRSAPFNTWAEQDEWSNRQILLDHYGQEESSAMAEIGRKTYVTTEHFVSEYRPELSRPQSEPSTTEP